MNRWPFVISLKTLICVFPISLACEIVGSSGGLQLAETMRNRPPLDLAVVVADPNVDEYAKDLHKNMVWPEVRNAESVRFAHQLKRAIERDDVIDRVLVTPSSQVSADLYLTSVIKKSSPEHLRIHWTLTDARQVRWFGKKSVSTFRVNVDWHERFYSPGKDAFQPIWDEIAQEVLQRVRHLISSHETFIRKQNARVKRGRDPRLSELQEITVIRDLALARVLNPKVYESALRVGRNGRLRIAALPDQTTEDWLRIQAFAAKDQQVTELYDAQYEAFASQIGPMYERWQNELFVFSHEARKASRRTKVRQILGGVILLAGLALFPDEPESRSSLDPESLVALEDDEDFAGTVATVGGIVMISSLFSKSSRKQNLDTFNERSEDFDHHFEPLNLVVQGNTLTLQGKMDSQFTLWRQTLLELYESEQASANEITILKQ